MESLEVGEREPVPSALNLLATTGSPDVEINVH